MFGNKKNRVLAVTAMILMSFALLCGCGKESAEVIETAAETTQAAETVPATTEAAALLELSVESTEEQGEMMVVNTTFGQVKYPFAFGDLIRVQAVSETASLEFSALIAGDEYPVFAVRFGSDAGILLGTLEIPGEAEPRTVSAEFYSADETALGDKASTFYAVQECFNDVVASLQENQGFTPAE